MIENDLTLYSDAPRRALRHISIMLVEDHLVLRQGLKALLETDPDLRVVGEADTVADALTGIEALQPSVVITDIGLADQSGIALIAALRERKNATPILVLTVMHGEGRLRDAMHAGANGFVLKDSPHAELVQGLQAVCTGKKYFCKAASKGILSSLAGGTNSDEDRRPVQLITPRERDLIENQRKEGFDPEVNAEINQLRAQRGKPPLLDSDGPEG